ncbi:hypothetical protein NPX13_g8687 [Xylaria arbuscula]|uniref:Uncharacterized protein n=1 Tax=Xylaria arbuscula TaxID=114810 RepID=A0A9W8N8A3_9PEZI|nr:hypothetical protein NPX13_g8687 [Xylaria arbuscula]
MLKASNIESLREEGIPYVARAYFEEALMYYPDHPSAIVGLSNILLNIYTEVLLPPPAIPSITGEMALNEVSHNLAKVKNYALSQMDVSSVLSATPLGLGRDTRRDMGVPGI